MRCQLPASVCAAPKAGPVQASIGAYITITAAGCWWVLQILKSHPVTIRSEANKKRRQVGVGAGGGRPEAAAASQQACIACIRSCHCLGSMWRTAPLAAQGVARCAPPTSLAHPQAELDQLAQVSAARKKEAETKVSASKEKAAAAAKDKGKGKAAAKPAAIKAL